MLTGFLFLSVNDCQIQRKETIEQNILGAWISNDDANLEINFDGNLRKDFYEGVLTDTYKYSISNSCGSENFSGNQYFLKSVDREDGSEYCLIIEAVNINNSGILSFTSDRGQLVVFNKK